MGILVRESAPTHSDAADSPDALLLRRLVIAAGLGWSIAFILAGLGYGLQMYADGSIFSYSVAAADAWTFHWRNISGRLFVYLFSYVPAETYVGLTRDARGGIALYGFLHFSAQLLGLAATFAADRSRGRIIFVYACASTACLCPLVFGFPTEMWMAHALFWPALALCHGATRGVTATALVFAVLLALVLTHEGAVVLAFAIVATLLLRGWPNPSLSRAAAALLFALVVWLAIKIALPPDAYFGSAAPRAALNFIDWRNFGSPVFLALIGALASYAVVLLILRMLGRPKAYIDAAVVVALGLFAYWLWLDTSLHTENRYYLRTALLVFTPLFGALAAAYALAADGELKLFPSLLPRVTGALATPAVLRAAAGAVAVVMLVHAVETAKFISAWTQYKAAVRSLAMGEANDPALGDPKFVSSARVGSDLNRLSWFSTTQFLSVLLAPGFVPARLVVDPDASYFWLSCQTARTNHESDRAIPAESRRLIRVHACLHR